MSTLRRGTERAGNLCFVHLFSFTANVVSHAFLLINFSKSRKTHARFSGRSIRWTICHPYCVSFLGSASRGHTESKQWDYDKPMGRKKKKRLTKQTWHPELKVQNHWTGWHWEVPVVKKGIKTTLGKQWKVCWKAHEERQVLEILERYNSSHLDWIIFV